MSKPSKLDTRSTRRLECLVVVVVVVEGGVILNARYLEKIWVKIENCALLLEFLALFCYTTCMPLIYRINTAIQANVAII